MAVAVSPLSVTHWLFLYESAWHDMKMLRHAPPNWNSILNNTI